VSSETLRSLLGKIEALKKDKLRLLKKLQEVIGLLNKQSKEERILKTIMSLHPRTGLPNHVQMDEDLTRFFVFTGTGKPAKGAIFLLRLDDYFDTIQRTLKPQMTEWILYQIGARIQRIFRGKGIYHLQENEFLIFLRGDYGPESTAKIARVVHQEVEQPHIFAGYNVHIGCNIGISLFPDQGYNKSYLLQNADIALQLARKLDTPFETYAPSMRTEVIEKMDLQNSIIRGLENQSLKELDKQFLAYYQPILEIKLTEHSLVVQKRYGESLIRWNHPRLGLLSPEKFVPLAEETGLIIPMGTWMMYHVASRLEQWHTNNEQIQGISVNLSPRQLRSDQVPHNVLQILKQYKFPHGHLKLEITESTLIEEPNRIIRLMRMLYEQGVSFSIDDFGTGYSSLSYVHQLPAGHLKIDKTFIKALPEDEKSRAIVRAIIAMAKELGFELIAEGIENLSQLQFLYKEGVRLFQGYLFAPPLPEEKFLSFMDDLARNPQISFNNFSTPLATLE